MRPLIRWALTLVVVVVVVVAGITSTGLAAASVQASSSSPAVAYVYDPVSTPTMSALNVASVTAAVDPTPSDSSGVVVVRGFSATEDDENSIERIYEPNPKHGPEPYIDSQGRVVSKAPTNGQGALDNSFQIEPTSPTRQGIDPDTGETVILPRHLVQNLPGGTVEYYHGYVP